MTQENWFSFSLLVRACIVWILKLCLLSNPLLRNRPIRAEQNRAAGTTRAIWMLVPVATTLPKITRGKTTELNPWILFLFFLEILEYERSIGTLSVPFFFNKSRFPKSWFFFSIFTSYLEPIWWLDHLVSVLIPMQIVSLSRMGLANSYRLISWVKPTSTS